MKYLNRFFSALLLSCISIAALAQSEEVPMADAMRANGKIYVVVSIVLVILAGLLLYVFLTDRKISKLEEKVNGKG